MLRRLIDLIKAEWHAAFVLFSAYCGAYTFVVLIDHMPFLEVPMPWLVALVSAISATPQLHRELRSRKLSLIIRFTECFKGAFTSPGQLMLRLLGWTARILTAWRSRPRR